MILPSLWNSVLLPYALTPFFASLAKVEAAENDPASAEKKASYALAQSIPVSCLNRTTYVYLPFVNFQLSLFRMSLLQKNNNTPSQCLHQKAGADSRFPFCASNSDTGEHITDSKGELQYIPFPTCNETDRPLEFYFGVEKGCPLFLFQRSFATCTDPPL